MQPSTSTGANAEELFWEQVEDALNKMLHQLVIVGRNGKQIYLIDDDKFHYESHSRNHRHWNIKFIKHVNDNRWGGVIDTLCIPALLMPCNVYTHRRGTTQIDASISQLFGSAFENNPLQCPDLTNIDLQMDRGYSGENQHQTTLAPSKAGVTCTSARAKWVAYNCRKRSLDGELVPFYTRMSCSDKHHQNARERAFGNINSNSMVSISVAEFDPSQHNVDSNLSFDDATMNTSDDEATTTNNENNNHNNNTADNNNSDDDSST